MWLFFVAFLIFVYAVYANIKRLINNRKNPYIERHKQKIKDDEFYKKYEEFCSKNGELPISKKGFEEYRKNDNQFLESVYKYLK